MIPCVYDTNEIRKDVSISGIQSNQKKLPAVGRIEGKEKRSTRFEDIVKCICGTPGMYDSVILP